MEVNVLVRKRSAVDEHTELIRTAVMLVRLKPSDHMTSEQEVLPGTPSSTHSGSDATVRSRHAPMMSQVGSS